MDVPTQPLLTPPYERVYHYHVRKTAGTSLNAAFWALGGLNLQAMGRASQATGNGLTFVRSNPGLIEKGDYLFANSHAPYHRTRLPPNTYTITILRDPAARVVSFYRYLKWAKEEPFATESDPSVRQLQPLAAAIDQGFTNFLRVLSPRFLLPQLTMFSADLDPIDAAQNALSCSMVCFTETFSHNLATIARELGLDLIELRERQLGSSIFLTASERIQLRKAVEAEYAMIGYVKRHLARSE